MPPAIPAPQKQGHYRIALVCLGNICRSPMADVVLAARIAAAGLDDRVSVVSSGTGDWHIGDPMDRRAASLLTREGYDASAHRAQQVDASWITEYDLLLAMDRENLRDLHALADAEAVPEEARDAPSRRVDHERVRLFGDFDPLEPGAEVPDPYYGGADGFRVVLAMVERTADAITAALRADLG